MKNKVQLITYADRLGDGTIKSMTDILRTRFDGVYDGVHILPFFTPFDGADAGFDPIDHTKVDERLGSWDDVAELSKTHDIMVDAIVNHMSWESKQFRPDGRLSRQLHPPRRRRLWRQGSRHQLLHDPEDLQADLPSA